MRKLIAAVVAGAALTVSVAGATDGVAQAGKKFNAPVSHGYTTNPRTHPNTVVLAGSSWSKVVSPRGVTERGKKF